MGYIRTRSYVKFEALREWPLASSRTVRLRTKNGDQMIKWAGGLIVFYGTAHTLGALTFEGAASHWEAWFSRELASQDLSDMSPAMSAYWLSVNSFGPPLILLGLTVLWMTRRRITPPAFIGWSMIGWLIVGTAISGPGIGQDLILLVASGLLLAGVRRSKHPDGTETDVASGAADSARESSAATTVPDGGQRPA